MSDGEVKKVTAEIVPMEAPAPQELSPVDYKATSNDILENTSDAIEDKDEKLDKDIEGEQGLLQLMSEAPTFVEAVLRLQKEAPEYLDLDEQTAKKQFKKSLSLNVLRLRMSLWQEYELARQRNRKMRATQIYAGVCSQLTWSKTLADNEKLAFIVTPPSDYLVVLKEAHSAGLDSLREIVSAKVVDEDGYLLPKAADAVIKAFALLDMRLKGAIIQRVDTRVLSKSMNMNVNLPSGGDTMKNQLPHDMDEVDRQLAEVREKIKGLSTPKHPNPEQLSAMRKDCEIPAIHDAETKNSDIVFTGKVYVK